MLLLALSTCDDKAGPECEPGDEAASLAIDNRSGGLVETITATPCEGGEALELTLPSSGIAFSAQATVELPGPGCWLLHWTGEECRNDPPYRTSTNVCAGETYDWTIDIEGRICDAGGW